jgi:hypothetical protein
MAVTPADDPGEAAELAITLTVLPAFEVRIVGCGIPSVFDFPSSAPMMGIPMPGFVMEQYIKTGRAEIQETCDKVICILDKRLPRNVKPEVCYVDGPLNQLVPTLVSMCEVIAIPHHLELAMKFRIRRPTLDSFLIKSKKIPILFCVDSSTCRRIVVAQIDTYTEPQAQQALSLLAESFHVPVYRWFPKKCTGRIPWPRSGAHTSSGIADSSEIDDESVLAEQFGTFLALPNVVTLAFFRHWKMWSVLRNWRGNIIVLP